MIRPHLTLLAAVLLLAGCASDAAQLAREVTEARGDCTQEKLKAGDEACVAMMEKYAKMGTSAIETYIGAVKSLDQALDRMPAANFDTAGFGHAFSTPYGDPRYADPRYPDYRNEDPRYGPTRDGDSRYQDPRSLNPGYADPRYPGSRNDGSWGPDPRYSDPGYRDPGYGDPRYSDPRYSDTGHSDPRYDDRSYDDRQYADPGYDGGRVGDSRRDDSGYNRPPPARGLLLPPAQRLDRPWLREQDDRYRYDGAAGRNARDEYLRSSRPGGYLPSRPLPADTLRRYDGSDGY